MTKAQQLKKKIGAQLGSANARKNKRRGNRTAHIDIRCHSEDKKKWIEKAGGKVNLNEWIAEVLNRSIREYIQWDNPSEIYVKGKNLDDSHAFRWYQVDYNRWVKKAGGKKNLGHWARDMLNSRLRLDKRIRKVAKAIMSETRKS